ESNLNSPALVKTSQYSERISGEVEEFSTKYYSYF
ncbi:MAG: hypothetical protein PWP44_535, partial [Thermacetogenium sp.]|nr:hypothetical protein [Thermacetogenium sp.]